MFRKISENEEDGRKTIPKEQANWRFISKEVRILTYLYRIQNHKMKFAQKNELDDIRRRKLEMEDQKRQENKERQLTLKYKQLKDIEDKVKSSTIKKQEQIKKKMEVRSQVFVQTNLVDQVFS